MRTKEIIKIARRLAKPFRVSKGRHFHLKDVDPSDTLEFKKDADKSRAKEALTTGITALAELLDKLYAQDKWALLSIFQAMAAAGNCKEQTLAEVIRNHDAEREQVVAKSDSGRYLVVRLSASFASFRPSRRHYARGVFASGGIRRRVSS